MNQKTKKQISQSETVKQKEIGLLLIIFSVSMILFGWSVMKYYFPD